MSSKRERILKAIIAAIKPAVGIEGRVYRNDPDGVGRELTPFINVTWQAEQAMPGTVSLMERTLSVSVSIFTRGDELQSADEAADPIAVDVHRLITADTTLGGLAVDTRLDEVSNDYSSADQTAGKMTHVYLVEFRHSYSDLTT